MLAEVANQRREVEEAQLAKQAELARPRPVVDRRAGLDANRDKARGGRGQVKPAYQYLQSYDEDEDMGYVESPETGAIIPLALLPNVKFDITSAMIQLL